MSSFAALPNPIPIAVPSSMPRSPARRISPTRKCKAWWSIVSGLWMKAYLEKTTRPILSSSRLFMKSVMTSLAASNLFRGSKSSADMLPEISSASAMSRLSRSTTSLASPDCGRANAMINNTIARERSTGINHRNLSFHERELETVSGLYAYRSPGYS